MKTWKALWDRLKLAFRNSRLNTKLILLYIPVTVGCAIFLCYITYSTASRLVVNRMANEGALRNEIVAENILKKLRTVTGGEFEMDYGKVENSAADILKRLILSTRDTIAQARCEKSGFYIQHAKDLIEKQIQANAGEITVGVLANALGLSKNYFGKIFKSSTGLSVSNYVNNLRIKRATELLQTTNMKVYEVGCAVGFENQHYFSVAFKQIVGVSPSEFRDLM
jgi:YesN/AraC family two-component response regulator